jgi:hypothetical protein
MVQMYQPLLCRSAKDMARSYPSPGGPDGSRALTGPEPQAQCVLPGEEGKKSPGDAWLRAEGGERNRTRPSRSPF